MKPKNIDIQIEQEGTKTSAVLTTKIYFEDELDKKIFKAFKDCRIKVYKDYTLIIIKSETNLCKEDKFDSELGKVIARNKVKQKLYKLLIQLHYFYLEYLEKIFAPSKLVNFHKYMQCFSKELDYYKKITKSNEDSNHCKKEQDGNKD